MKICLKNCCANNLLTLFDGKLYRCPTAAHGVKLKAIPEDLNDIVELGSSKLDLKQLKDKIKEFYYNKNLFQHARIVKVEIMVLVKLMQQYKQKPLTFPNSIEKIRLIGQKT